MHAQSSSNVVSILKRPSEAMTVLIVEDDRMQRMLMEIQLKELGYTCKMAENGQIALEILNTKNSEIDIVVMDRMMPVMDGISAVRQMKEKRELRHIPVIMLTSASTKEDIKEGLDAGAFYYLTKPFDDNILKSVLQAASREILQKIALRSEANQLVSNMKHLNTAKFEIKTLDEAESLSAFLAQIYDDPERVLPGIAELLINAVEHGNLEIGYQQKTLFIKNNIWRHEIEKRQSIEPFNTRVVDVVIARKNDGIYLVITDAGKGFEWRKYLMIDPARAGDNHGRGIAQARAVSFDSLSFNESGNQVVAFVSNEARLEW